MDNNPNEYKLEFVNPADGEEGYIQEPSVDFHENLDGELCATLWGWDVPEMVDGYNIKELDDLIQILQDAKSFIIENVDNPNQMDFQFGGDGDV